MTQFQSPEPHQSPRGALSLCRASAGTGKTYSICDWLEERVLHHGLDPARILATTFTIEAAAELKSKVQARLLAYDDKVQAHAWAERLELAAIGTVDAVGYRLLERHALTLGLSPALTVLPEDASGRMLERTLASMPPQPWEELAEVGQRLGVPEPQRVAKELLELKRENAIDDERFRAQLEASAERFLDVAAPGGPDPSAPSPDSLPQLAAAAADAIRANGDTTKTSEKALEKLNTWARLSAIHWEHFASAARVKAGKRSGADACLDPIRKFGHSVRRQPEFHRDLQTLHRHMADQTIALETSYQSFKADRGWVDFTDLEVEFLRLLEHPITSAAIMREFQVVVVDEFQDTNPLQLAIFERLRELVDESYWVGDPKQAIYSFRGTDPSLLDDLWSQHEGVRSLRTNRRSQEHLVHWVNALFEPEFGDDVTVSAHREPQDSAIEFWRLEVKNVHDEAQAITTGIDRLLQDDVVLGDIAVLVRTNKEAERLGEACRNHGLPAVVELPGLLAAREAVLAVAGLRLVADRWDSLAAATLLHWWPDEDEDRAASADSNLAPSWLRERLAETAASASARNQGQDKDPSPARGTTPALPPFAQSARLAQLDPIRANRHRATPSACLAAVIQALELPLAVQGWSNPEARPVQLDSLLVHAQEYESSGQLDGQPRTLTGLIEFLESRARSNDDKQIRPRGLEAITISTYHKAKGLEWPVVIASGLDSDRQANLFRPRADGRAELGENPLANRTIHYWPWPLGTNVRTGGPVDGVGLLDDAMATEFGQSAREAQIAESLRLLYVGMTRARDRLIIAARPKDAAWLNRLKAWSTSVPDSLGLGDHSIAVDTDRALPLRVRRFSSAPPPPAPTPPHRGFVRRGILRQGIRDEAIESVTGHSVIHPRAFASPSLARREVAAASTTSPSHATSPPPTPSSPTPEVVDLGGPLSSLAAAGHGVDRAAFGDLIHAYFAALPSLAPVSTAVRESVAARILSSATLFEPGPSEPIARADRELARAGERLRRWVDERYPGATWKTETPIHGLRDQPLGVAGGEWRGVIDLLLELPDGRVILVDHKSTEVEANGWIPVAERYRPQITAYRDLLTQTGSEVADAWIHLPIAGAIVAVETGAELPPVPPVDANTMRSSRASTKKSEQLEFDF